MSDPATTSPLTPVRPARSIHRISLPSVHDVQHDPFSTRSNVSSTDSGNALTSPHTPVSPLSARPHLGNRESTSSIRRKPVPDDLDMTQVQTKHGGGSGTPLNARTPYILHVDPPRYMAEDPSQPVPSYPSSATRRAVADGSPVDVGFAGNSNMISREELPSYAIEAETEPKTLARALWRWGFACPLLWFIGMWIMWVPLRPAEEDPDAEKAQKLEEMIVILRKTELRYAKRCAMAFCVFALVILAIITISTVVAATRH